MYGSIAEWRTYAADRGDDAPTNAEDDAATQALTRASDYVRSRYVANLSSPNTATTIPDGHTLALSVEGAYIAASFELATVGFFSKTFTPSQQKVLTKASSITWKPVGDGASSVYGASPVSTKLDELFRPYIFDRDLPSFNMLSVGRGDSF